MLGEETAQKQERNPEEMLPEGYYAHDKSKAEKVDLGLWNTNSEYSLFISDICSDVESYIEGIVDGRCADDGRDVAEISAEDYQKYLGQYLTNELGLSSWKYDAKKGGKICGIDNSNCMAYGPVEGDYSQLFAYVDGQILIDPENFSAFLKLFAKDPRRVDGFNGYEQNSDVFLTDSGDIYQYGYRIIQKPDLEPEENCENQREADKKKHSRGR